MTAAVIVLFVCCGVNAATLVVLERVRRERRRLEALRYGVTGRAFNERRRDEATSRLRP